jgi:hypothetical protein
MMYHEYALKQSMEFFIFIIPICLHGHNYFTKFSFNKLLEIKKHVVDIRTLLEKVDPCKFNIIINKT